VRTLHFDCKYFNLETGSNQRQKSCHLLHSGSLTNFKIEEEPMSKPVIADKKPAVLELEAGTYYYCTCGQSSNQPFCDGKHQGTDFTPMQFKLDEKKKVALCQCKHTNNAPFCDGAHLGL